MEPVFHTEVIKNIGDNHLCFLICTVADFCLLFHFIYDSCNVL